MKTGVKNMTAGIVKVTGIFALTLSAYFMNAGNVPAKLGETETAIKQQVKFPSLILPTAKTEKVEVVFTTAANGKVDFVLAKTQNDILKKELEKQFLGLTLNKLKANVAYSIVFNFKTI